MTRGKPNGCKDHQVLWRELQPWVDQLFEEHGLRSSIIVSMEATISKLRPTIVVELFRTLPGGKVEMIRREYTQFDVNAKGSAESLAIRMMSRMLLDLDNEKERAERQASIWPV